MKAAKQKTQQKVALTNHFVLGQQQSDRSKNNGKIVVSPKTIKARNLNLVGLVSW